MTTTILLFDVDGTLLLSGGAGTRALTRAFEELFGVPDGFTDIPVAGRTDPVIFDDALMRAGLTASVAARGQFQDRYCDLLEEEIVYAGPRKGVMPGVRDLLSELATRQEICCALLTGNFARSARIKLEHFELWRFFACGAYGDDAAARDHLVPIAVERARRCGVEVLASTQVVVVGDTPADVQCARAAGVRSVVVATGGFDQRALRACGAGAVLPDLSDTSAFTDLLTVG